MERLYRNLAGCGLALSLVMANAGCRSTKSEVPPSPTFSNNGQAPIGFSQDPNPPSGMATGSTGMPPAGGGYGIPNPSTPPNYGMAGGSGFGAPGSNVGTPSTTVPGSAGLSSPLGASNPATGLPQTGTGPAGPAAGIGAAPTQNPF